MEQLDLNFNTSIYDQFGRKYCLSRFSNGSLFNDHIEAPVVASLIDDASSLRGKRALDIGCGPGIYTKMLLSHDVNVTAIDSSSLMLDATKEYCESSGYKAGGNLEFIQGRYEETNFNGSYDLILATFMISYFEDLTLAFIKMRSQLKKGGYIITSMLHPFRMFERDRIPSDLYPSYFEGGFYQADFLDKDSPLKLRRYNFSDIFFAATSAGLRITKLIEPKANLDSTYPDRNKLEYYSRHPSIVVLKLVSR
ncbi:class I SAM-dependent methyltransferase [Janthinobacterium svalbardensis]|uniref:class I SAM-dependent methyltransferase n=1 Tax=Janthinobacterium svalbardensis TaxID=368607 RepID=UPI002FCDC1A6